MKIEHELNTDYIDCIKEIIIKNPYGCSIEDDVETITTYDPVFHLNLKMPPISKYFVSETVTIKGHLSGGKEFILELPIDSKKQIKMTIDESEIINEEIKEEVGEALSAKDAASKTMEVISRRSLKK